MGPLRNALFSMSVLATLCLSPICFTGMALTPSEARAEAPPSGALTQLSAYDPQTGNLPALLQAIVPKVAPTFLKLGTNEIVRGGPLSETLGPTLLSKLDGAPGSLPMVVYKKEDGRLPSAFIVARYQGVLPKDIVTRLSHRSAVTRHPLIAEFKELSPPKDADASAYGPGATRRVSTFFIAVDMPFGAGLFGLKQTYVFGEWENILLPNGIAITTILNRPGTNEEKAKLMTFADKKGKQRKLEDDYFEGREYRLSHLFIPEKDASGQLRNTVQVYFVRIVPALKPGTDLVGNGALAQWVFKRGAQDAVVVPVKLIREGIEQAKKTAK